MQNMVLTTMVMPGPFCNKDGFYADECAFAFTFSTERRVTMIRSAGSSLSQRWTVADDVDRRLRKHNFIITEEALSPSLRLDGDDLSSSDVCGRRVWPSMIWDGTGPCTTADLNVTM